jgi:hypothetical protein
MTIIAAQRLCLEHHIPDRKHVQTLRAAKDKQLYTTRVLPIDFEQLTPEMAPGRWPDAYFP